MSSIWDSVVLALMALLLLATGLYARRKQYDSADLLLAGRSLSWWGMGLSLTIAGITALVYASAANDAYFLGTRYLLVSLLVWPALPLACWCTLPLYTRLGLESVHEYVELRFGAATRAACAGLYVLGQLIWLAGLPALACRVLHLDELSGLPAGAWLIGAGALVTLYTFLGGMKASIWTDIVQVALAAGVAVFLVLLVGRNLDSGLPRIWQVAEKLGRTHLFDFHFDPTATWSAWFAVPGLLLLGCYFLTGDQATLQRFFAGRHLVEMKLGALVGCAGASLLLPAATYLGLGLLALYHDRAQHELPPNWVASLAVDPHTGRPRLDPNTPITPDNVQDLAEQGLILDPNTQRPFEQTTGLLNARGEVVVDRLATRLPPRFGGERILRRGKGRLLYHFLETHLLPGLLGLAVAAFVGVSLAAVDSGLIALATILVVDFHRRFGWATQWLARRCGKPAEALDLTDELLIARPLLLGLGVLVTLLSLLMHRVADLPGLLLAVLGAMAGPLLAVFLLGIFTRRATSWAAMAAMAGGLTAALYVVLARLLPAMWPGSGAPGVFLPVLAGFSVALVAGGLLTLVPARRRDSRRLEGLVVGLGRLGVLEELRSESKDEVIWLDEDSLEAEPGTAGRSSDAASPWADKPWPTATSAQRSAQKKPRPKPEKPGPDSGLYQTRD